MKKSKNNFSKKFLYALIIACGFILSLILSYGNLKHLSWNQIFDYTKISDNTTKNHDYPMHVHFLNVGKADCAYIKCEDKNILIDAADKDFSDTVVEYLKRLNVEKFDLVAISHPHRDHIGQMDKVIETFKIDKFIEPKVPKNIMPTSVTYENMLTALNKHSVNLKTAKANEKFKIGNLKFEILGPISAGKSLNNNSLVLKITYKNISFLFTGDAEQPEESAIINAGFNLKSTVLKVAHHGSNTSSTYKFLGKVSPKYAVISVGPDRSNLPKEKTLKRLNKFCDKIYRTDMNGTVIFLTDGEKIEVKTEK